MRKQTQRLFSMLTAVLVLSCTALAAELIPLGIPIGVRMTAQGVVVSELSTVDSPAGVVRPADQAGLETGDILQSADGTELSSSEQLADIIAQGDGQPIRIKGIRGETPIEVTIQPVQSSEGVYRIGLLIRDSMAGIGTLTYVDPQTKDFGALGHPISDVDSGTRMPLETGSIVPATVVGAVPGTAGTPGELIGTYDFSCELGTLSCNTACGIFGTLTDHAVCRSAQAVETADASAIHTGSAEIRTCISGSVPQTYDIIIESIEPDDKNERNLSIRITDEALLKQTGGIVPGMSGSPILQDGKLIGAVTHTLVNDPSKGYGILIENMLAAAE